MGPTIVATNSKNSGTDNTAQSVQRFSPGESFSVSGGTTPKS